MRNHAKTFFIFSIFLILSFLPGSARTLYIFDETTINQSIANNQSMDDTYNIGSSVHVDDTQLLWNITKAGKAFTCDSASVKTEITGTDGKQAGQCELLDVQSSAPATSEAARKIIWVKEPASGGTNSFTLCVGGSTCSLTSPFTDVVLMASWDKPQAGAPENAYPASLRTGHWIPLQDNTFDIGQNDTRFHDLYLGGAVKGHGSGETVYINGSTGEARFSFQSVNISQNGTMTLWNLTANQIQSKDWSNVSINESQMQYIEHHMRFNKTIVGNNLTLVITI